MSLALAAPSAALADDTPSLEVSGHLKNDLRFYLGGNEAGTWYAPAVTPPGVVRNQTTLRTHLEGRSGRFAAIADVDLVLVGYPDTIGGLDDLSRRDVIDPFRIEAHALYIEARDLIPRVDLRIGQQLAQFGVGDQFNPTNNLNANDVEDPLLFGDQLANIMVRADWWFVNTWSLTGVLVPVFKPANVPPSASAALTNPARLPFLDDTLRWRISAEQGAAAAFGYPTTVEAVPVSRAPSLENMQFAFRLGGILGGQDLAVSYYRGFSDIPVPSANHSMQVEASRCNPDDEADCIDGVLSTRATLIYPRIDVIGLNAAGEIPLGKLPAIGYRLEAAAIKPGEQQITLTNDEIVLLGITQPAGEYDYGLEGGGRPQVLDTRWFPKWALGLDYTFGAHVYVNAQWVHGFIDELGAGDAVFQSGTTVRDGGVSGEPLEAVGCALAQDGTQCAWETLKPRIGDYLVLGIDVNFAATRGLIRLFTIWDLVGVTDSRWDPVAQDRVSTHHGLFTKEGFSGVIYPQISYNVGRGLELEGGVLLQLGKPATKFGDPANGGSLVWTRAKMSF